MATRGTAIGRVRSYFREAPLDEVEVAFELVKRDIAGRLAATGGTPGKPAVVRKPRGPNKRKGTTPGTTQDAPSEQIQETLANA